MITQSRGASRCERDTWGGKSTPNCLTFVKTTAIAYGQNIEAPGKILPICNSSRFYKRQAIWSSL